VQLSPGVWVGRYEIVGALGAGGMGEVYRARDTRLNRVVALKVLLRGLSGDPRRRERFEREAQVISSLNHAHICSVYDVGCHEGADYLVMELLEGQTMAERIQRGPLPLDEAIRHGIEIADALEAAHHQGIVHRDLKPANVFLARSGGPSGQPIAKLLDFGIAKAIDPSAAAGADQATLTEEGTLLGTLQYMAPEQLEGRAADTRSDLFAFGAVLYEMLTGRRAFDGESPSRIIAAVLDSEPSPLVEAQPLAPPLLAHVVMTCLAKNPDERWQSAADVRRQLAWIASSATAGVVPAATTGPGAGLRGRRAIVGACIVALGVAGAFTWRSWSRQGALPVRSETRLEVSTPATTQPWSIAISPDGLTIAFVAESEGRPVLWVRPLNEVTARPLRGTSEATDPFWSPDNQSIGFFADGKLKRIDLKGGTPQTLADAIQPHGGAWSRNGIIVFAPHQLSPLLQVSADGGAPSAVTQLASGHGGHMYPRVLPDDDHLLYYVAAGRTDVRGAYLGRRDGTPARKLLVLNEPAEYASTGHLLFLRDSALFAQALDVARLELNGSAIRVADRIAMGNVGGATAVVGISASNAGAILYRGAGTESGRQLTWYDRSGTPVARVGDADVARIGGGLSLSPDGHRAVVGRRVDKNGDLWLRDLRRNGAMTRLTFDPASDDGPLWSRDGLHLTFSSNRNGSLDIYQRALGANSDEPLLVSPGNQVPVDWSPDGRVLLYLDADARTHLDIWAMPVGGEKPFPVVRSPYEDLNPQFSPDGKWIAYQSNESSRYEVYLRPFGDSGALLPVSTNGATQPRWRRDGKELFYLGLDRRLMAVPIAFSSNGRSVDVGTPAPLFQTKIGGPGISQREYEVSSDGQRILIDVPIEDIPAPIILIQNWRP